jgi:hypothetical protein
MIEEPKTTLRSRKRQDKEVCQDGTIGVHVETIAIAVAEQDGKVRSVGVIPNRSESVRKLGKKLGRAEDLRFCYEAGPAGAKW